MGFFSGLRGNGRGDERREVAGVSGGEGGVLSKVTNGVECSVSELWVGGVGADVWGRVGLGLSSERSLPGRNVLYGGVSLWYFSIGSFSVVGWWPPKAGDFVPGL